MVPLLAIESIFLGANLAKLHDGGYVPLLIAAVVGLADVDLGPRDRRSCSRRPTTTASASSQLIAMLKKSSPSRAPGTAVFLTSDPDVAPSALLHNLKHNHVLHEPQPDRHRPPGDDAAGARRRADDRRAALRQLHPGRPDLRLHGGSRTSRGRWRSARSSGSSFEMMSTSYFLNRRSFRPSREGGMPLLAGQALHLDDQGRHRRHRLLPPAVEPGARARPAIRRLTTGLRGLRGMHDGLSNSSRCALQQSD